MEIRRKFHNLMGEVTGFQECKICKDRENWKPFRLLNHDESTSDKIKDYNLPICEECFTSFPLDDIIFAVKKDMVEINNFTRKLRYTPFYTDSEIDIILAAVKSTKEAMELPSYHQS